MSRQEIADFCNTHNACSDGRDWALDSCESMHDVWLTARPDWLIWVATRPEVLSDRDLRLFACWCARQVWHLLKDDRSKNAVIVAEKYAVGEATAEELKAAEAAAEAAVKAAWGETWTAEWAAARSAEWTAAAEWAAAEWSAEACAAAACAAAALSANAANDEKKAAREAQAEYLRDRFSPFLNEETK